MQLNTFALNNEDSFFDYTLIGDETWEFRSYRTILLLLGSSMATKEATDPSG